MIVGLHAGGLFTVSMKIRTFFLVSVEDCEGYNSLLKSHAERAPRIGLPLLVARCNSKKALGLGKKGADCRWRAVRASASTVLHQCLPSAENARSVSSQPNRWSSPASSVGIPSRREMDLAKKTLCPTLALTEEQQWAKPYNSILHAWCKLCSAERAFCVLELDKPLGPGDICHLMSDKNYSMTMCTSCSIDSDDRDDGISGQLLCRVMLPLATSQRFATDIIAELYSRVQDGCVLVLLGLHLEWTCSVGTGSDHSPADVFAVVGDTEPLTELSLKRRRHTRTADTEPL